MARERAEPENVPAIRASKDGGPWLLDCPVWPEEDMVQDEHEWGCCVYCRHRSPITEGLHWGRVVPEEHLDLMSGRCSERGQLP